MKPTSCVDVLYCCAASPASTDWARSRQLVSPVRSNVSHRLPGRKPLVQADGAVVTHAPVGPVVWGYRPAAVAVAVAASCCEAYARSSFTTSVRGRTDGAGPDMAAVGADVALPDPLVLVAMTWTRKLEPRSISPTTYVDDVAPVMVTQAAPPLSQRLQR